MNRRLGALIAVLVLASGLLLVGALSCPFGLNISINGTRDNTQGAIVLGIVFWVGLPLLASTNAC